MSFRDMSSVKRQSTIGRTVSVRTSRRMSTYNSVVPNPEPLEMSPHTHPLKRKFEPVLLDRYPAKDNVEESRGRCNFPDYVPMFAFPNDINVVSSDTRPRSTWHGFTMTSADNSKLHAVCITMWIPLSSRAAEELEKRCEEWRKANMTDAERELASNLGERLAAERAKLSRLLAQLPSVASESDARDQLEDEISAVEEKITLMTDMLRPLRHGAASRIEGLTESETGLWIPRAYGILGRDVSMASFWKEWLRAVVVPMTDGGVLRVPPSSPRTGMWAPLERYVINLCTEAPSPLSSKTQVEVSIRELRMYARKEAINELPGSRNTDLYPLFRSLSIPNIVVLFEYLLSEARIILISSHTSMLYAMTRAVMDLLFPFKWAGVLIPILPARLLQALHAPTPYLIGIEKRYENYELPEDDFVIVDLDTDVIESTAQPIPLPRQQRRKLVSLLQLAAPLHYRFGVKPGPPLYCIETYPFDAFSSESPSLFSTSTPSTNLAKFVNLNSTSFGATATQGTSPKPPLFNVFSTTKTTKSSGNDRPRTSSTSRTSSPPQLSPVSGNFPPLPPMTPISRNDSGFALQATLREKRSGYFDEKSRRSSSFGTQEARRRPSIPFLGHSSNLSVTNLNSDIPNSGYAPSTYAQSTLAASTIMPQVLMQPVRNTETTSWVEGHCLQWRANDDRSMCSVCEEKSDSGMYRCSGCGITVHTQCGGLLSLPCPVAFYPDQVRAAFVRCFASLLFTYRKHMGPPTSQQRKNGFLYSFDMNGFLKSLPSENADYVAMLQQTQAFNEFISERETTAPASLSSADGSIATEITLFDSIIMAKRNRGRIRSFPSSISSRNPFSSSRSSSLNPSTGNSTTGPGPGSDFLSSTSEHLWRTASASINPSNSMSGLATPSSSSTVSSLSSINTDLADSGDPNSPKTYREIITRVPAKLDSQFMKPPRMIQGTVPGPKATSGSGAGAGTSSGGLGRKPLPKAMQSTLRERLNGLQLNPPQK
ncbi:putative ddenn domain-containing protein [Phaeomoniella chlamydospora]|uniref:Putative ddenn domain-containing protein n=1 Tax=Phaeomoniella chlamydospora TaxID=158046 RepID=A0A0G2GZU7_PHACM|nr:putative ddenn domain-containing protein [Phaeomoniella chlamydospora]